MSRSPSVAVETPNSGQAGAEESGHSPHFPCIFWWANLLGLCPWQLDLRNERSTVNGKNTTINVVSLKRLKSYPIPLHFALTLEVFRGPLFKLCHGLEAKAPPEPRNETLDWRMQAAKTAFSRPNSSETNKIKSANYTNKNGDILKPYRTQNRKRTSISFANLDRKWLWPTQKGRKTSKNLKK